MRKLKTSDAQRSLSVTVGSDAQNGVESDKPEDEPNEEELFKEESLSLTSLNSGINNSYTEELIEEENDTEEPISRQSQELIEEEPSEEEPFEEEPSEEEPFEEEPNEDEPSEEEPNEDEPPEEVPNEDEPSEEEPNEDKPSEEEPNEGKSSEEETNEGKLSEEEPNEDEPSEEEPNEDEPSEEELSEDSESGQELEIALNSSNEKKRSLDSTLVGPSLKKSKRDPFVKPDLDVGYSHKKFESFDAFDSFSEKQENTGSSVKRRRSRWDSQPDVDGEVGERENTGSSGKRRRSGWDMSPEVDGKMAEDNRTSKRKKTRWSVSDASILKMLGPIKLPDFVNKIVGAELDPEYMTLKLKLFEITKKLQAAEIDDNRPEYERSPSPPPIYGDFGFRINTRSDRLRAKLILDRQDIVGKMIRMNPTFKPPPDCKPAMLSKKLYIPVKEYPSYNFIGLIIGPRGNTQRRMEKESGARIRLRGRESRTKKSKPDLYDDDDLHIYVEADNQNSLDKAVGMVEKLLIPVPSDENNAHKLAQLRELAELKGTLRGSCKTCGKDGHLSYVCPSHKSTFSIDLNSTVVGGDSRSGPPLSNKKEDYTSLFVGCLPTSMDDQRLVELFNPYGSVESAKVVMDWVKGSNKGYGFVKYDNPISAATAVSEKNGFLIDGKFLVVRVANSSTSVLGKYQSPTTVPQVSPNQTVWPGPPGSVPQLCSKQMVWPGQPGLVPQVSWPPGSAPQVSPNQIAWPGPPGSVPQVSPNQRGWPGPLGSVPQVGPNQMAWPGPPGSEPPSSSRKNKIFNLPPVSIFPGHSEPSEEKQVPSSYGPAYPISTSSSPSTLANFPGKPSYPGQFQHSSPYYNTPPTTLSGNSTYTSYSYTPSISSEQLRRTGLMSSSSDRSPLDWEATHLTRKRCFEYFTPES
ncbi:hypothetical protein GIB67_008014 [Kingdonia uniflora]|uniref:Branchpoint-bridging protein n=1 Tax=Kingdonia uniflora TaxID=39325 RepID=A0A7J7MXD8_9MAGN|nr:hypothetical protein GIB67_008014 [Kingdonia uniflora]